MTDWPKGQSVFLLPKSRNQSWFWQ